MTDQFSTQAVHAGEERPKPHGALTTPIVQTSTYTFQDTAEILDFMRRKEAGDELQRVDYGRYGNPTQNAVESKMASLEGGERALLFGVSDKPDEASVPSPEQAEEGMEPLHRLGTLAVGEA